MTTATKEKNTRVSPQSPEGEGWEPVNKSLPPFINPSVGNVLQGVLKSYRTKEEEEGKVKKLKYYWDLKLTAGITIEDSGDSFDVGSMVTFQGTTNFNRDMIRKAYEYAGEDPEDFDPEELERPDDLADLIQKNLIGREFFVQRLEDQKIQEGKFKGKKAKRYNVQSRKA